MCIDTSLLTPTGRSHTPAGLSPGQVDRTFFVENFTEQRFRKNPPTAGEKMNFEESKTEILE